MQVVGHYGLHSDDGVWYLHQGRKQASNFISLNRPSPFEVLNDQGKKQACPHLVNSSVPMPDKVQWEFFLELFEDPLLPYFLPIPRTTTESIPYVVDPNNELIMSLLALSRLSSPIYPVVHQIQHLNVPRIQSELRLTNIAPFVITNIKTENQYLIEEISNEARRCPRRLILVGDPMLVIRQPLMKVQTFIQDFPESKLHSAPMESLGAVALRRWARGEQINTPWVRKEEVSSE
jgi:hypothetical protein